MRSGQIIRFAGAALLVATLSACTQQGATAPATSTAATTSGALIATGSIPSVANDLASNSAHHSLPVPGEQFALTVDYWTDYNAAAWQTLQPKNINLSVHLAQTAAATGDQGEVLIGSFNGTTTLLAAMPGLDGLPIAETNQEPNAIAGYLINANYPYDNVLTIEGFSAALADRWATVAGDQVLTEPGLVAAGVYANRITLSYRILVKNTGDAGYHQRIVTDALTVSEAPQAEATSSAPTASTAPSSG